MLNKVNMSLNKVMLIGNAGKDPEIRYIDTNQSNDGKVASFSIATSERYRDKNGEQRENTEWHNVVAYRGLADVVEKYVKKGTQVYVEGKLRTRSWTDQSGTKKYTTEIIADALQLLGRKSDNPAYSGPAQGGYQNQYQAPQYNQTKAINNQVVPPQQDSASNSAEGYEDDLPF